MPSPDSESIVISANPNLPDDSPHPGAGSPPVEQRHPGTVTLPGYEAPAAPVLELIDKIEGNTGAAQPHPGAAPPHPGASKPVPKATQLALAGVFAIHEIPSWA